MMIGNNPLTSHYAWQGSVPPFSPSRRLRDAKARGLKLICVDPRRTMVAQLADIHLQVRPGEDATLLAGMLRLILDEDLHDRDFCESYVSRARGAVPRARRLHAGVRCAACRRARRRPDRSGASLRARPQRGVATTGTGAEMATRGSLTEHFVQTLNIVCGRFCREGETAPYPRVLSAATPRKAQVQPPAPLWGEGFAPSRVRGLTQIGIEMPTAALADEILLPGDGQVRALICIGGNPLVAWPNQAKVERALRSLDLLVCIDIKLAQTARLAHYVIAPQYQPRARRYRHGPGDLLRGAVRPLRGGAARAAGRRARRVGVLLGTRAAPGHRRSSTAGGPLPMDRKPDEVRRARARSRTAAGCRSRRVREETREGGRIFAEAALHVEPADPDATGRLQLVPDGVADAATRDARRDARCTGARRRPALAGDPPARLPPHAPVFQFDGTGPRAAAGQGRDELCAHAPGRPAGALARRRRRRRDLDAARAGARRREVVT